MDGTLAKREIPVVYAAKAPFYDLFATLAESRARDRALALAAVQDGETVLEVAVGTGLLFAELLRRNPHGRTEGVDLTEAMLARARAKAARAGTTSWRLRVGDAYDLDFAAGTFDLVLNAYLLDLLPETDFPHVLGELHRVLRPGGRLVLVNMARAAHWGYRLWEAVYRRRPAVVGGCRGVEVVEPVRRAGFRITAIEQVMQVGFASEVLHGVKD
jgi:ubiquinone/menaquinone biosynthesis C-methylase UbiE